MTTATPSETGSDPLAESTNRMIRTVDGLDPAELAAPSLLPGWSRAHVVAHLALNGEGLAGAVTGIERGEIVTMYASNERRDADIEELAAAEPSELRNRLLASATALDDALRQLSPDRRAARFPRIPDGPEIPVSAVAAMRRREVEIHHVDLDAGYRPSDWPVDFRLTLLELLVRDRSDGDQGFGVHADDLGRSWTVGNPTADALLVHGAAADLAWWLAGRGSGEGLHAEGGAVPRLGPWR